MTKILLTKSARVATITLNRPDVRNAIDNEVPALLSAAVADANADPDIHVIVLQGAGEAFCAGYDLAYYTSGGGGMQANQPMPWDPMQDYAFMSQNTEHFMSLFRSQKPTIAKVQGYAVAGGSDIALCCDFVIMADDADIGYMPARVWGCPTTAMWVYRVGMEKAKRMLLTGDKVKGPEAVAMGLVLKSVPIDQLDAEVDIFAQRMASVPINQLMMQKMVINQAVEAMGLAETQRLATVFDGIIRHSPEGVNFLERSGDVGWKQAVQERDQGTFDWTRNRVLPENES